MDVDEFVKGSLIQRAMEKMWKGDYVGVQTVLMRTIDNAKDDEQPALAHVMIEVLGGLHLVSEKEDGCRCAESILPNEAVEFWMEFWTMVMDDEHEKALDRLGAVGVVSLAVSELDEVRGTDNIMGYPDALACVSYMMGVAYKDVYGIDHVDW